MRRSHSRHSFPKDKGVPKEEMSRQRFVMKWFPTKAEFKMALRSAKSLSGWKQSLKKMHKKKRRQIDKLDLVKKHLIKRYL